MDIQINLSNLERPEDMFLNAIDELINELTARKKGNVREDRGLPPVMARLHRLGRLMAQNGYVGRKGSIERAAFYLAEALPGHSYAKNGIIYRQELRPDAHRAVSIMAAVDTATGTKTWLPGLSWAMEYEKQWLEDEKEILKELENPSESEEV